MNTVNRIFLVGRVGREPEQVPYGNEGKTLTKFSLATDRPGKDGKTDWHQITAFGQAGVFAAEFLNVGDLVHVEGRQENEKREDGGFWPGVVADRVTALPSAARVTKEAGVGDQSHAPPAPKPSRGQETASDDDLPF